MRVFWTGVLAAFASLLHASQPAGTIEGIGPVGAIEKYQTGFFFTEGPAGDGEGGLYFSDIMQNKVFHAAPDGTVRAILDKSNLVNGLAVDASGRLLACQGRAGRIIAIDPTNHNVQVIADQFEGKPFNQPNDLVLDHDGGLYFTDPEFLTKQLPQGTMGVYYVSKDGAVRQVARNLDLPNGIALSPDGKTLYVVAMGAKKVLAHPVREPGVIGPGNDFFTLEAPGDGMTIDAEGNLYVTQPDLSGIVVIRPNGERAGMLLFPEKPANCAFGGPEGKTLFATARRSVYAVPMQIPGMGVR